MEARIHLYEPLWGVWKVDSLIGEGNFGQVYKVSRQDFDHVYYSAVKIISIPQTQSQARSAIEDGYGTDPATVKEYFKDIVRNIVSEIEVMTRLKGDSHIVSYEDHMIVEKTDGIGWDILIRMELLTPLGRYLESHAFSAQDIVKLGIDICLALERCQKSNLVHRDIKPANIFISESGDFKLGDFGIARQVEKTTSGMSRKGTFLYMAPEAYLGQAYSSSVDIYSLGLLLYRFLNSNRLPFMPMSGRISFEDNERSIERRMKGEPIPPPVQAEGRLAEIILKACAFDPKARFESPRAFRNELESIYVPLFNTALPSVNTIILDRDGGSSGNGAISIHDERTSSVFQSDIAPASMDHAVSSAEAPALDSQPAAFVSDGGTESVFPNELKTGTKADAILPVSADLQADQTPQTETSEAAAEAVALPSATIQAPDMAAAEASAEDGVKRVAAQPSRQKRRRIPVFVIAVICLLLIVMIGLGIFGKGYGTANPLTTSGTTAAVASSGASALVSTPNAEASAAETWMLARMEANLMAGAQELLTVISSKSGPVSSGIVWRSSNVQVVTVDATGLLTAVGSGSAEISASTPDGRPIGKCLVTISAGVTTATIPPTAPVETTAAPTLPSMSPVETTAISPTTSKPSATATTRATTGNATTGSTTAAPTTVATTTIPKVSVPNLAGQSWASAQGSLASLGLTAVRQDVFSSSVASGNVVSQSVAAGTVVNKGTSVTLSVSKGPQYVTVPNVIGKSRTDAEAALRAVGLTVGSIYQPYRWEYAYNTVFGQGTASGTSVVIGSAVGLSISNGTKPIAVGDWIWFAGGTLYVASTGTSGVYKPSSDTIGLLQITDPWTNGRYGVKFPTTAGRYGWADAGLCYQNSN